jgi:plastocyanin
VARIVVADGSDAHNSYLTASVVNAKTSLPRFGAKAFAVRLGSGTYRFVCDPHPFMKGSFTVG